MLERRIVTRTCVTPIALQAAIFFCMADETFKDLISNTQELIRHHREVADKAEEMLKRFLELEKRMRENEEDKR
jgi:predicted transcriptional regulator